MTTISDKLTSIYNAKKDIKSAINSKGQSVGDNINDYAAAIRNIEQGSGGGTELRNWWKVYFIDYDGTILSYQEVANGADFVFPDAPNHEDKGLVFDGWNFTSNHTRDYDPQDIYTIVIGAMYEVNVVATDNTKLYCKVDKLSRQIRISLAPTVADGITINWGDGTTTATTSTDGIEYSHTYDYSKLGDDVVIELICSDGCTYEFTKLETGDPKLITPTSVEFGIGCTSIGGYAFNYCLSLLSVTIPSTVTSIGVYALSGCYSLLSVNIPSSVTYIGSGVFQECHNIQSITIPSSVTYIGDYAFQNCFSLQSITIPSSVTSIDSNAFAQCYSLRSVTIPSSVTSIGNEVLSNCHSLLIYNMLSCNINKNSIYNTVELTTDKCNSTFVKSITIPSGVTSIGNMSFSNCFSLQSINIPESVTDIGYAAFFECRSLQSVTIPSSVTYISSMEFGECRSLQSVTIPSSVTYISSMAFHNCISMRSINIPSSVTNIDGAFSNCHSMQSINIPESVTEIGNNTFNSCYSLKSVTIPASVTSIRDSVFSQCSSLRSVTIPSSVTSIGSNTFFDCKSMQSVAIPSSVTNIDWYAFYGTRCVLDFGNDRTNVPIISSTDNIGDNICIVPDALYDSWCAETNWSTMTEKIVRYSDYYK